MDNKNSDDVQLGYRKEIVRDYTGNNFDCTSCNLLSRDPRECKGCGAIYCLKCLENIVQILGAQECLRCTKHDFQALNAQLSGVYDLIKIVCACGSALPVRTFAAHEAQCKKPAKQCKNFSVCGRTCAPHLESVGVCDLACVFLAQVLETPNDWNKLHAHITKTISDIKSGKLVAAQQRQAPPSLAQSDASASAQKAVLQGSSFAPKTRSDSLRFCWDTKNTGTGIYFQDGNTSAYLFESQYIFRTVISDTPFMSGVHYWELSPDSRTENEMKIGVTTAGSFNFNSAFSDYPHGFSYYGLGQLRCGSNAQGGAYGRKFKNSGVCGVCLDMTKGTLSFSLNGEYLGVAYRDENLKNGPIYAAVALLHAAGIKMRSGLPVPSCFLND